MIEMYGRYNCRHLLGGGGGSSTCIVNMRRGVCAGWVTGMCGRMSAGSRLYGFHRLMSAWAVLQACAHAAFLACINTVRIHRRVLCVHVWRNVYLFCTSGMPVYKMPI
jgi:hypothetical protein